MEPRIHAYVMAGGSGSRLRPLTDLICKPALPFGPSHRVIDFVLANLRNSGVAQVDVLMQHRPAVLRQHVQRSWSAAASTSPPFSVRLAMPPPRPEGRSGAAGYLGTADAVYQNLLHAPVGDDDLVAVFGADHVYRLDLRQMIQEHCERRADVSVAALPVPIAAASEFGVLETDGDGRVLALHEKPSVAIPMPGRPLHALVSMGNYLFSAAVLKTALAECCGSGRFDFGHDVLPHLLRRCHVHAYDFQHNVIPGLSACEERAYWRDVGTLDAYFSAQMDTLGPTPRFALDNAHWPLAPRRADAPTTRVLGSEIRFSQVGPGARIERAVLDRSVVAAGARVLRGARLLRSVVFEGVTVGTDARLYNVIVAEGNSIPAGERIGYDLSEDRGRFPVTPGGIVVVPPHHFRPEPAPRPMRVELAAQPAG
jgi:glucose-1-phosphate adenylyltransferase